MVHLALEEHNILGGNGVLVLNGNRKILNSSFYVNTVYLRISKVSNSK